MSERRCHACGAYAPKRFYQVCPTPRPEWDFYFDEPWSVLECTALRMFPDRTAEQRLVAALDAWAGLRPLTPHHVVPRSRGGSDEKANLIDLCHEHHVEVHRLYREFGLCR